MPTIRYIRSRLASETSKPKSETNIDKPTTRLEWLGGPAAGLIDSVGSRNEATVVESAIMCGLAYAMRCGHDIIYPGLITIRTQLPFSKNMLAMDIDETRANEIPDVIYTWADEWCNPFLQHTQLLLNTLTSLPYYSKSELITFTDMVLRHHVTVFLRMKDIEISKNKTGVVAVNYVLTATVGFGTLSWISDKGYAFIPGVNF